MNDFVFWVNGDINRGLDNHRWIQGDTLTIIGRGHIAGLIDSPLPTASLTVTTSNDPMFAETVINAKPFSVEFRPQQNMFEMELLLEPADTKDIILDKTLGLLLNLPPSHRDFYKPAKYLLWEVQIIQQSPRLTRSYQGNFVIHTDYNKDNLTATPAPSPSPTPAPTPSP